MKKNPSSFTINLEDNGSELINRTSGRGPFKQTISTDTGVEYILSGNQTDSGYRDVKIQVKKKRGALTRDDVDKAIDHIKSTHFSATQIDSKTSGFLKDHLESALLGEQSKKTPTEEPETREVKKPNFPLSFKKIQNKLKPKRLFPFNLKQEKKQPTDNKEEKQKQQLIEANNDLIKAIDKKRNDLFEAGDKMRKEGKMIGDSFTIAQGIFERLNNLIEDKKMQTMSSDDLRIYNARLSSGLAELSRLIPAPGKNTSQAKIDVVQLDSALRGLLNNIANIGKNHPVPPMAKDTLNKHEAERRLSSSNTDTKRPQSGLGKK